MDASKTVKDVAYTNGDVKIIRHITEDGQYFYQLEMGGSGALTAALVLSVENVTHIGRQSEWFQRLADAHGEFYDFLHQLQTGNLMERRMKVLKDVVGGADIPWEETTDVTKALVDHIIKMEDDRG